MRMKTTMIEGSFRGSSPGLRTQAAEMSDPALACFSLTPRFSGVEGGRAGAEPFQGFGAWIRKPLKRFPDFSPAAGTLLKRGVNDMKYTKAEKLRLAITMPLLAEVETLFFHPVSINMPLLRSFRSVECRTGKRDLT